MSDLSETPESLPTVQQHRTKRLSSFIWIWVIWILARVFSELNPLAWEKTFYWAAPIYFGAFPVTVFLLLSIASNDASLGSCLRRMALITFLICVTVPWVYPAASQSQSVIFQGLCVSGGLIWVFVFRHVKSKKVAND